MSDAPRLMSLEGRAVLIADMAGRLYPDPAARRKAVEAEALAHLRVVAAKVAEKSDPYREGGPWDPASFSSGEFTDRDGNH